MPERCVNARVKAFAWSIEPSGPPRVILSATGSMPLLISAPARMWMVRATVLVLSLVLWVIGQSFVEGYCVSGLVVVLEGYGTSFLVNALVLAAVAWCVVSLWRQLGGVEGALRHLARAALAALAAVVSLVLLANMVTPGPPPGVSYEECVEGWHGWDQSWDP